VDWHFMGKGRFLNQQLGKRTSRRLSLLKSQLTSYRSPRSPVLPGLQLPKKGTSRQQKPKFETRN
jgi:hypothetical protein